MRNNNDRLISDKLIDCNLVKGCLKQIWIITRKINKYIHVVLCFSLEKRSCNRLKVNLLLRQDITTKHVELHRHIVIVLHRAIY
ncbi:hypothetical protein trycra_15 [Candidatus Hodgkinia cicadicola]|uniref:Uncharacterized protein n=1 Tax=Candidatus Hodgkinia cicadicola TaxID=573658 RepID=A0ABX4MH64_9HYPH|nr:hypothetical protein trycra_15 [Candidatus Hodgkinia cicadicola]